MSFLHMMKYCNTQRTLAWWVYNAFISRKWCIHNQTYQTYVFVANMMRCQQLFIEKQTEQDHEVDKQDFVEIWSSLHVHPCPVFGTLPEMEIETLCKSLTFCEQKPQAPEDTFHIWKQFLFSRSNWSNWIFVYHDLLTCWIGNHCFTNSLRRPPWRHPFHHGGRKFRADGMGCGSVLRPVLATDLSVGNCWAWLAPCWYWPIGIKRLITNDAKSLMAGHRKFVLSLLWSCQGVPRPDR